MTEIHASLYGIVQGLSEFLPISSSGHLALLHSMFGETGANTFSFDISLHIATALAVIVYFRRDLKRLVFAVFRVMGRLPIDRRDSVLVSALVLGTIPAAVVGVLLEDIVSTLFRAPVLVTVVLVVGSVYLIIAERRMRGGVGKTLTVKRGIMIGCAQALALFPGFSRSGATIGAGMMLGMSRVDATRFSFLLALPIIIGSGLVQLLHITKSDAALDLGLMIWGGLAAFVSGLFVITFLLKFVRSHTLCPFIWYRIVLAIAVMTLVW